MGRSDIGLSYGTRSLIFHTVVHGAKNVEANITGHDAINSKINALLGNLASLLDLILIAHCYAMFSLLVFLPVQVQEKINHYM